MAHRRTSYRNPFVSALLYAALYFLVSNAFYWVFHGHWSFVPFYNFDWMEYMWGTGAMALAVLVLEIVRNLLGRMGGNREDGAP